jgi:fucose 4-O-acetylase-like acetyltransferase
MFARPAPREIAAATPAGRDRYADFLRVASMVVVVCGHWLMTAVAWRDGQLAGSNVLGRTGGLWLATWVLQVMPVFFFVGGFANLVAVRSLRRRGGGWVEFVSARAARLLRPTLVFVACWLVLVPLLELAGVPAGAVRAAGALAPQLLWFLGVYLAVTALAPPMARLHRRFRLAVPLALAAAALLVDLAWLGLGLAAVSDLNLLLVWLAVQQLGFFYADGTLARRSRAQLRWLALAGLGSLALLVASGAYPRSMVSLPGDPVSNMNPPTVCILALAVWQVALVMLARPRVTAWLRRPRAWTGVVTLGSMAMTLYLWHLTALLLLLGLVLALRIPLPVPAGAAWWLSRPLWLAALLLLLAPLLLALARFERPRPLDPPAGAESRRGRLAAVLGLVYATFGLFGFVVGGFAPLPNPAGSALLGFRVDPLQSLACLALGALLLRAARAGAGTPAPWLAAAATCALLLLPWPVAGGAANRVLHAGVMAVALAAALATRRAARATAPPAAPAEAVSSGHGTARRVRALLRRPGGDRA